MTDRITIVERHLMPKSCIVWHGMPEEPDTWIGETSLSIEGASEGFKNLCLGPEACLEWENE